MGSELRHQPRWDYHSLPGMDLMAKVPDATVGTRFVEMFV